MYSLISNLLRKIFPAAWLHKNQIGLRKSYATIFVRKGDCHCSVCNQSLKEFVSIDKNELICPACGSGKRHRRLFALLREQVKKEQAILDFSPNAGFLYYARKAWGNQYFTTNYDPKDSTNFHFDITAIAHESNAFDVIICYHVLEHITADAQAINELYRILKPGGTCWIQTPFKEGEIYEDFSIERPEERLQHFHQEDHVRIYSAKGLAQRLSAGGFKVEILHFQEKENPDEHQRLGYKNEETIIWACK